MKKFYTLSIILFSTLAFGQTPISLIGVNVPYTEDFNGMGAASADYLPGWTAINVNTGSTLTLGLTNGSAITGNAYNVGTTGDEERAFGTLADASVTPALGAVFQNNTGSVVSKISIQNRMKQWKESGNAGVNESVAFYYSLDATSLNTGTWTAVTTLNLNEKLTSATSNNAVNGNLASNYTFPIQSIINLNWANGANLWIKWVDSNDSGANGMYAIDNFIISVNQVLGVKQNTIAGLNMYPNPVSNQFTMLSSELISNDAKVEIYTSLGQVVLTTNLPNDKVVDVSQLSNGFYFVKISENNRSFTQKIIKK